MFSRELTPNLSHPVELQMLEQNMTFCGQMLRTTAMTGMKKMTPTTIYLYKNKTRNYSKILPTKKIF